MQTPNKKLVIIAVITICLLVFIILFSFRDFIITSKAPIATNDNSSNNTSINSQKIIDSTTQKIQSSIRYILDIYPNEIDAEKKKDELRHGFQVHVQTPTWMVIKSKLLREGFKRISFRDFNFNSYNGIFNRFKATLSNTDTVFFECDSFYGKKVVIAIAVNNTGVKDREILIQ